MLSDSYVCELDEQSLIKAKEELKEDPGERLSAVESLRTWAEQQKWLTTPKDTRFLLGFLRVKKFSQLLARERLERYWSIRSKTPEWFCNLDSHYEKFFEIIDTGMFLIIPGRDSQGRKFLINRMASLNLNKVNFNADDVFRMSMAFFDYLLMDENVQVNGIVMMDDLTNFTIAHQSFYGIDRMKRAMPIWQEAQPVRYKGFHLFNPGPIFEGLLMILRPFMTEKFRSRIIPHGKSLVPVYKHIDKHMFPLEYLPDDYTGPSPGTINDVKEHMKQELLRADVIEHMKCLSNPANGINEALKSKDDVTSKESYRKLAV